MFHSLEYRRRGRGSYLAIVNVKGRKQFGKILVFASVHANGYATVQLFEKKRTLLFQGSYADFEVNSLMRRKIFGAGFTRLVLSNKIELVHSAELLKRFIFVSQDDRTGYTSEELYSST